VTSPPYFGLRDYGHDGQIGLEPTPDEFVAALVAVFREVRRVLRDDGTVWLNLGDSYAEARATQPSNATDRRSGREGEIAGEQDEPRRGPQRERTEGRDPGLQAEGPHRHPVDGRVRPPRRRLVSPLGHHLGEAEPDAGERHGPADEGARVPVPAVEGAAVLLRR
jgi:hypothetical protein